MARKNLPWEPEFNQKDNERIFKWIIDNLNPWDRWGRHLMDMRAWKANPSFSICLEVIDGRPVSLVCEYDPGLEPVRARKMLQVLGFRKDFIASYEAAQATAAAIGEAVPEEGIFESMLFTISHAGAGVNLHKILTEDKASEARWRKQLRAAGKTWADVQLPPKAQTEICGMLLKEIEGCFPPDLRKNTEALRTRFQRYAKRYFS